MTAFLFGYHEHHEPTLTYRRSIPIWFFLLLRWSNWHEFDYVDWHWWTHSPYLLSGTMF